MPIGGLLMGAGSVLARAGIIRGTVGRMLGGAAPAAASAASRVGAITGRAAPGTAMTVFRPGVGMVPQMGGAVAAGMGGAVARGVATGVRTYGKKVAGLLAAGVLIEAGGKLWNAFTGKEYKEKRRMNYGNPKALRRGIKRVEGASKQYAKLLRATTGGIKKCGYTVKPRTKSKARCS